MDNLIQENNLLTYNASVQHNKASNSFRRWLKVILLNNPSYEATMSKANLLFPYMNQCDYQRVLRQEAGRQEPASPPPLRRMTSLRPASCNKGIIFFFRLKFFNTKLVQKNSRKSNLVLYSSLTPKLCENWCVGLEMPSFNFNDSDQKTMIRSSTPTVIWMRINTGVATVYFS